MSQRSPLLTGLARGFRRRCPACGEGRLFRGYLKVAETCAACGHANGVYPADDAPPYFTMLIVGHVVVAPMLALDIINTWPIWWLVGSALPALGALTLALLPLVKGAVIGLHWATGTKRPLQ